MRLIRLPLGVTAKFFLVLVVAVLITFLLYELVVRRFAVTRRLFGMRAVKRAAAARLRSAAAASVLAALVLAAGSAFADPAPHGRWYAEGGAAQVEIDSCGDALCGRIVWLRAPFDEDGCELTDRFNPEEDLRARPLVGLPILTGLEPDGDGRTWHDGRIYDPTSGRTYRCTMKLDGADRLRVRGYFGIELLGRTTTWIRVGSEQRSCGGAPGSDRDS